MTGKSTFDIFINYRRQDTRADAGRLYDRIGTHFGNDHVFMDIDDINPGQNFVQILENTLDDCAVLIVLIGTDWINSRDNAGERRLEQEDDFVRIEIQRAIERNITVIPVLVGRAKMPDRDKLPAEIDLLSEYQAVEVSDKRFHTDVDRLIAELETINGNNKPAKNRKISLRWPLTILTIITLGIGFYFGVEKYQKIKSGQDQIQVHLEVGDQFLEQQDFKAAIEEYEKAVNLAPRNIDSYRKMISAQREHLLRKAFLGNSSLNIGLVPDYIGRFAPVKHDQVSAALNLVYRAQALEPTLKNDPNLLLDEAFILKTSGTRARKAIDVLEKARILDPQNPTVLAELGLLKAVLINQPDGLTDISHAIEISPNKARYHFYLAWALAETYLCRYAGKNYTGSGDVGTGCAQAIKEFHRSAELASDQDVWNRHILGNAITGSFDIFHRYSRKEKDILTPKLSLTIDERIKFLEFLIPLEMSRSRTGWQDYPLYWLAVLYEAKNQSKKAAQLMHELLTEQNYRSSFWMEFQTKLLEKTGDNPEELKKIQSLLEDKRKNKSE